MSHVGADIESGLYADVIAYLKRAGLSKIDSVSETT